MQVLVDDGRVGAVAPERSHAQRMAALRRANVIRSARAELKREIKARPARTAEVIAEPPVWVESMKVFDLLLATPKFGRVKVNTVLRRNNISPSKTVGGLSKRQRDVLLVALGARGLWP